MADRWADKIFNVVPAGFDALAMQIFSFQYENNPLYKAYADMLDRNPSNVKAIPEIPFLPISFFKTHEVKTTQFEPQAVFESSGTTGSANSHHLVREIDIYRQGFLKSFERFYGSVTDYCVIGLLPSYLERKNSSLIFMVDELIRLSPHPQSGFYLNEFEKLYDTLKALEEDKQKTLLIGVSFAILDFAERYFLPLKWTTIMETGGMKGRREEMIRPELHQQLQAKFQTEAIHSEYGMTELLSQAYSRSEGIFHCPAWMRVTLRDEEDPMQVHSRESLVGSDSLLSGSDHRLRNKRGIINVIDLANIYSCSFIATDDAGKLYADGSFEVLGRIDNSDIRGCSLMVASLE
jgi:phenylacetate-coenzyme A ligase PaaK-like adenylate-forming protein